MKAQIDCPYGNGEVDIPEGYKIKKTGNIDSGDKVLNVWEYVFKEPELLGGRVKDYWCVITKE